MEFLANLIDTVNLLLRFLLDGITSLIDFLSHIPVYFNWAVSFVEIIPVEIRFFAVASIALSAVLIFIPAVKE